MKLGPAMIDVAGLELTVEEAERLRHPGVGGVILFARNFETPAQLVKLVREIRAVRYPAPLIAVDHEGGRVQRFKRGFSRIPPMRHVGQAYDRNANSGLEAAHACGRIIAAELQAHGVDFSFAPVLDVDYGESGVIGDRAFHAEPEAIAALAEAFHMGLAAGGMASVGKHFPGHGYVRADSHHEVPVDERPLQEILAADLVPFGRLVGAGMAAVMPAHVIYPRVDDRPAGFSPVWLQEILRDQLGFDGLVFSDDLSMEGARTAGGIGERADAALEAGCDVVLLCNDAKGQEKLLEALERRPVPASLTRRLEAMRGKAISAEALEQSAAYLAATDCLGRLGPG